ncbi:MAG: lysyl oxidase family protein [Actinomycetota bacterium]
MRRNSATAALLALLLVMAPVSAAAEAPELVARLGADDSVFWQPKPVTTTDPLIWRLEVLDPGLRLRVALDKSNMYSWALEVEGPSGSDTARSVYSAEVFIGKAQPGIYTVRAIPNVAARTVVRFRAKLEQPRKPRGDRALLPNLRITPPYDLTLTGTPWYFYMAPEMGPSCFPEETAQTLVTRCLRFSFGPENAGEGPLELVYAAPAGQGGRNVMYQQITHADGRKTRREAGSYEYHAAHAHYHHPLIAGQQLFKVTDPKRGGLEPAGTAKKTGFCMGDYTLVDWERFYQDPAHSVPSSCGLADAPYRDLTMGLSTGWNDIYSYDLEGNYIDFDDQSDGLYVIRAFTDRSGDILETNESDNLSYAYFRVTGEEITLLERGYGSDPWDRNKKVLNDPRNHSVPD